MKKSFLALVLFAVALCANALALAQTEWEVYRDNAQIYHNTTMPPIKIGASNFVEQAFLCRSKEGAEELMRLPKKRAVSLDDFAEPLYVHIFQGGPKRLCTSVSKLHFTPEKLLLEKYANMPSYSLVAQLFQTKPFVSKRKRQLIGYIVVLGAERRL